MLKELFENKAAKKETSGGLSREDLERTRDLLVSTLAHEEDREKLKAGVAQLADINASLRRCDDVDEAHRVIIAARRTAALTQQNQAHTLQNEYQYNCGLIANTVLSKDAGYKSRIVTDHSPMSITNIKMTSEYLALLNKNLSFEDAARQVDEILTASIQKREWKEVVALPNAKAIRIGTLINEFGEHISV